MIFIFLASTFRTFIVTNNFSCFRFGESICDLLSNKCVWKLIFFVPIFFDGRLCTKIII